MDANYVPARLIIRGNKSTPQKAAWETCRETASVPILFGAYGGVFDGATLANNPDRVLAAEVDE